MKKRFSPVRRTRPAVILVLSAALAAAAACSAPSPKLAPGESRPGFPMIEEGTLAVPADINFPIRVHGNSLLFTTREGILYSVDATYRRIVWLYRAGTEVTAPPETDADAVCFVDRRGTVYRINYSGELLGKVILPAPPSTAVRENGGRVYFGTADGKIFALDSAGDGKTAFQYDARSPVRAGPVFSRGRAVFGTEDGELLALDAAGRPAWAFRARGSIAADPAVSDGRVFAGTAEGYYYGLDEKTGLAKWIFRLGGAPLFPPAAPARGYVVCAAANSVVYCLSGKSGELRWWQAVPSRVVHAPLAAGGAVIVTAHGPELVAYDLATGRSTGEYRSRGEFAAGALWVPPHLVLAESAPDGTAIALRFLTREILLTLSADHVSPVAAETDIEFRASVSGFETPLLFEFYLESGGRRTLMKGPSPRSTWTWRPQTPGTYGVIVRAFDRFRTREAHVAVAVEKKPGKA